MDPIEDPILMEVPSENPYFHGDHPIEHLNYRYISPFFWVEKLQSSDGRGSPLNHGQAEAGPSNSSHWAVGYPWMEEILTWDGGRLMNLVKL